MEMCRTCQTISGVLILLAGVVLFLAGYGSVSIQTAYTVAGALLALYGLGALIHAGNACPFCKAAARR